MIYDTIIIGAGPAGLSAGIYAKRAGLSHVLFRDKFSSDSQICSTYEIRNYLGIDNVSGMEIYDRFMTHAKNLQVNIVDEKVTELLDIDCDIKKVKTTKNLYEAKTIILATGARPKELGINMEKEYVGAGISYCATCDGDFYKGKDVAVVGGGDVAFEDAIFLSRICNKVYILIRKNVAKAVATLVENAINTRNIEIYYDVVVDNILINPINKKFYGISIRETNSKILTEIYVSSLFVAIGMNPNIELLKNRVVLENGYIKSGEDCATSISGIYAVGDIRSKNLRQVVTAVADGANAITTVERYLMKY